MRGAFRGVVTVAVVTLTCLSFARADGPITPAQCSLINPNPEVTECSFYLKPLRDVYNDLPYDTVPAYQDCVKARCVCTGAAVNTAITTSGMFCNSTGWKESGYTTCNRFNHCFVNYWKCLNTAAALRYDNNVAEMTDGEIVLAQDIVDHGRTPGENFETTDIFRSCRLKMCDAAKSRENCGLITCLPNYTQCNEYMLPPPLPYTHQLCTQGCRAVLLMMALTLAILSFSFCCMACCPAQVIVSPPIIKEDAQTDKKAVGSDASATQGSRHGYNTRPDKNSPTPTNPNSQNTSSNSHLNENRQGSSRAAANGAAATAPHAEIRQQANNTNDPF
ncbi:hypothetical protein ABB37_09036 [Leptomonas pyrrhocoris]|uniref:Uncharacterized protein n=1 Tax=Leptomonas pyrrhocoris TaxID=157538 RepID=A0A0N0VDA8_LEPPY|nr:hypothetical protein ABB37_09036 [Leptomonas pyrrhocoris]XP_015653172.1 hypothetical protein ABB37_09036 [Leptomonas pyrrhocoris]KPA74732.1 hypothetical protein ABB37_09036 [Leptomonas pyrrhocoris]KPA74733.1 hypothetical protein ABB37_09036 [Leptomonas pyrrhocoris]|eukprot:XP_015653171.1 hypothetical protein ABB37_09036 [Leptomonas pyrrhocoris]